MCLKNDILYMDLHLTQYLKHPVTSEAPGHHLMCKPSAINSHSAS